MRCFNTEGPVRPDDHYAIPPLARIDVDQVLMLIRTNRYFELLAPPRSGKTSVLLALCDLLNSGEVGNFRCVHANIEVDEESRDDVDRGIRAVLGILAESARALGDDYLGGVWQDALELSGPFTALNALLTRWCRADPTPLVLLLDDVDSLAGDALLSVLRQIRAGFQNRPRNFPPCIVLGCKQEIRDYRIWSVPGEAIPGGSPFNIIGKSLRLTDFTEAETRALMAQHTEETGQMFTAAALDAVWEQTEGQPWLVNAVCASACFEREAGRDRTRAIEAGDIRAAGEALGCVRRTSMPARAAPSTAAQ